MQVNDIVNLKSKKPNDLTVFEYQGATVTRVMGTTAFALASADGSGGCTFQTSEYDVEVVRTAEEDKRLFEEEVKKEPADALASVDDDLPVYVKRRQIHVQKQQKKEKIKADKRKNDEAEELIGRAKQLASKHSISVDSAILLLKEKQATPLP